MGPRIILHDAIPIDSNIGGSGHRPILREVVLSVLVLVVSCLPFLVSILFELFRVSAFFGVSVRVKVALQRLCFPPP